MNPKINGVFTALITPFSEKGEIDWKSFEMLLDKQFEAGIKGVVLSGTTGEASTLAVHEKLSLVKKTVAKFKNKLHIMVGSGTSDTEQSVQLSKLFAEAGADSLLVVTPPYNKPNLSGLKKHFEEIASQAKIPVCLYHVPGRTAQRLSAAEMAEISSIKGVNSIKEASGDIALFTKTKIVCDQNTALLSGDDLSYLASLSVGADGIISVLSNLFPKEMVKLTDFYQAGKIVEAQKLNETLFPLMENLFIETNPAPAKYFSSQMFKTCNKLRLPLDSVSDKSETALSVVLNKTLKELKDQSL